MITFPLYDNIVDKLKTENVNDDISDDSKESLIQNINKMCSNEHEIIYVLIKVYNMKNEVKFNNILPYYGRSLKAGIKFDIDKFPNKLKHILVYFLKMHLLQIDEREFDDK